MQEIPPAVLAALNEGSLASANLVEWLAVDQGVLLGHFLASHGCSDLHAPILDRVAALPRRSVNTIQAAIGAGLLHAARHHRNEALLGRLLDHPSDSVRCWAAHAIGQDASLDLADVLTAIQPLAADPHFGVREVAWMAVRPRLARELDLALPLLQPWTQHPDENLRRFASEVTRPRGVWCSHIVALKENPALGLPLLESLRNDPSRYVQNSVANWLNDAAKSQPAFVRDVLARWLTESPTAATGYIVRRGMRSCAATR